MPVKYETHSVRQQQIINAARKIIVTSGSEHVTIKRLASEVGISEAAIYRHFNEKRDVLLVLADDIGETLLDDIRYTREKGSSVLDRLDKILNKHISAIEQRRGVSFQIIAEIISMGDKELNARVAAIVDRYIAQLTSIFEEAINNGELQSDLNANAVASMVFGLTQGLVDLWALNNYKFNLKKRYNAVWSSFRQLIATKRSGSYL